MVRGIPQGDPLSPCILAQVLRPWHALIQREVPDVSHWAFIDDRSLRAHNKAALERALRLTKTFDVAVGLKQHPKKLQVWGLGDSVEHLGVVATITNLCRPVSLRGGWQRVFDLFSLLPRLPGGLTIREAATRCFIKPVWSWCLPYLQVPPQALAKHAMQALLCTACTWWCRGRSWVHRIDLHPVFGTAVAAIQAAVSTPADAWRAARPSLEAYAAALRLEVVAWHGALPVLNASPNTLEHRLLASCCEQVHGHLALNPASSKGQHGLRAVARLQCLRQASETRFDYEGLLDSDIHAFSSASFVRWRNSLSSFQSLLLRIYRGGAVFTPTRRYQENSGPCPFCKAPVPSMRHFWADCPRFQSVRASIMLEYGLDAAWFSQQPRCTAKTGFITFQASPSPQRREQMQVATCKLALAILEDTWGSFHAPPGRIVP